MKHIASVSFGKDSLAMLLRLIEEKWPLDEVVFYDTGMEFKAIYMIRDRVKILLEDLGIQYAELRPDYSFEWKMFDKPVTERNGGGVHYGYSWCGGRCRWGTTDKLKAIEKYCGDAEQYVGIAADEPERLSKERKCNKRFPLAEWGTDENKCLTYCFDHGYDWVEDGGAGEVKLVLYLRPCQLLVLLQQEPQGTAEHLSVHARILGEAKSPPAAYMASDEGRWKKCI